MGRNAGERYVEIVCLQTNLGKLAHGKKLNKERKDEEDYYVNISLILFFTFVFRNKIYFL